MADNAPLRVIVTGAAQGIGLGIFEHFVSAGHDVCALDPAYPSDAFGAEQASIGRRIRADVSNSAEVSECVDRVAEAMGGIDVVINNAGVGGPRKPLEAITDSEWRTVHAINLDGPFFLIRAALPYLRRGKSSSIINIVTTSIKAGLPLRAPYVTSKAALLQLTQTLAACRT